MKLLLQTSEFLRSEPRHQSYFLSNKTDFDVQAEIKMPTK